MLVELLYFLNSQVDQVEKIIIDTNEEYFQFISDNPSNGENSISLHHRTNVEEIGIMYRVINNKLFFESLKDHDFGRVTLSLKLNIQDHYFTKNNESLIVKFEKGKPQLIETEKYQVEINMDISEFSSMVLGIVPFSQLYQYSKAEISDKSFITEIDKLFCTVEKPVCHTRF